MLTVRLHGHLEEKFGSEFQFEASNIREVIDALQANFDDFTEEFIKDERAYNILVDYEMQDMEGCILPVKKNSVIDIVPVILGAGFLKSLGLIIVGALLIWYAPYLAGAAFSATGGAATAAFVAAGGTLTGITAAAAYAITAIGWGLALAGVASLLAGPDGPDGGGEKSSSLSQAENIVGQGMAVPIGYGKMMVGSMVLSATSTSSFIKNSKAFTYADISNPNSPVWRNHIIRVSQPLLVTETNGIDGDPYIPPNPAYTGITETRYQALFDAAAALTTNASYQIVPHSFSSTSIRPTSVFVPGQFSGIYVDPA